MKKLLFASFLFFCILSSYGQTSIPKAQAMFIYNFSRLINWPSAYRTGSFVIGVLGDSDTGNEIKNLSGKMVGSQTVEIKNYSSSEQIGHCHILFVPFNETKNLNEIITKIGSNSTLVIGEKSASINAGATISFVTVADKLKYEINPSNGQKAGLTISSRINDMAYKVH